MTTNDATDCEPAPANGSMSPQCFKAIERATGIEAAVATEQGTERALVSDHDHDEGSGGERESSFGV